MTNYTDAMIKKYGSIEAWKKHQATIGAKGGSRKIPKGFAVMDKKLAAKLRSKGGVNAHKKGKND